MSTERPLHLTVAVYAVRRICKYRRKGNYGYTIYCRLLGDVCRILLHMDRTRASCLLYMNILPKPPPDPPPLGGPKLPCSEVLPQYSSCLCGTYLLQMARPYRRVRLDLAGHRPSRCRIPKIRISREYLYRCSGTDRRRKFVSPIASCVAREARLPRSAERPNRIETCAWRCAQWRQKSVSSPRAGLPRHPEWIVALSFAIEERMSGSDHHPVTTYAWQTSDLTTEGVQIRPADLERVLTLTSTWQARRCADAPFAFRVGIRIRHTRSGMVRTARRLRSSSTGIRAAVLAVARFY